ncbi:TPA: helix-turn-helix domain-containing protein [Legionella anisa]|uniref:helix-turn-helix domain-containing protein n=1 Tax=Legionella anisa TaxID=28082 RepID=UPI00197D1783|nr:helix-turn-helix domain-containing protein [Legionella anisa]MBN5937225.1 Fis family transcriptional regulator [Legionella anisa]
MNEKQVKCSPLSEAISELIRHYLKDYGNEVIDLHLMVLEQIEPALIETVMSLCQYNQSRAAHLLGLSRGTLRGLLKKYFDEKYFGKRYKKECV